MADGADDRRVRDQLKVLTGLKLPGFNWNANNMRMEFDIFWQTLEFVLDGMDIPRDKWYLYILQQLGREGMQRWTTSIEATVNKEDPLAIIKAFKKGYELEETYRHTGRTEAFISAVRSKDGEKRRPLLPPGLKTWSICVSGQTSRKNKDA